MSDFPVVKAAIDAGRSRFGWSRLERLLTCPQAWAYDAAASAGDDVPTAKDPLIRGSLFHVFAAHHYAIRGIERRGEMLVNGAKVTDAKAILDPVEAIHVAAATADRARFDAGHAPAWAGLVSTIMPIIEAYPAMTANMDSKLIPVAVETEYPHHVVGTSAIYPGRTIDVTVTSRLDLVVYDTGAKRFAIDDYKTQAGREDPAKLRGYGLSGQIAMMRAIGAAQWPTAWGGVFIRSVKWTPPLFTKRAVPAPAPWGLATLNQNILDRVAMGLRLKEANTPLHEYPKAMSEHVCEGRYGPCSYQSRCQFGSAA